MHYLTIPGVPKDKVSALGKFSYAPYSEACQGKLGQWIKDTLKKPDIDTKQFSVHATKGAST